MASEATKDADSKEQIDEHGNDWIRQDHANEAIRQTSDRETSSIDPSD